MVRMSHFRVPIPRGRYWRALPREARVQARASSEGNRVVKELKCRDAGFDCDAVVHGETVDDVMEQAGPHAKEAHGLDVTPEMAGRSRTLVHDA